MPDLNWSFQPWKGRVLANWTNGGLDPERIELSTSPCKGVVFPLELRTQARDGGLEPDRCRVENPVS